jgi:hypothetical protein
MLKPRYRNFSESVQDFNRMLDGMNNVQPLERSFRDDLQEMFDIEQELVRLDQQIEHAHRVVDSLGVGLNEAELDNLKKMHADAASSYQQAADKARAKIQSMKDAHNQQMLAKMRQLHDTFRKKAQQHESQAGIVSSPRTVSEKAVSESVAPSMMRQMRILAGLEESGTFGLPRDPGVLGTTRFNEGYEAMAQLEGGGSRASKSARQDALRKRQGIGASLSNSFPSYSPKEAKQVSRYVSQKHDPLDRVAGQSHNRAHDRKHLGRSGGIGTHSAPKFPADKKDESKQWAAAAVKHPGRLHKHFGIPEGKKIPMSKIKAEYNRLKDKEDKSAEETSLMRALALGIRFKGGDVPGGEKKKGLAGD